MARVSKKRLDKKTYTEVLDTLDLVLGKLKKDEIRVFLFSLMSGTERLMISKRFAAIVLLQEGISHTIISETLKMTRATIAKLEMQMYLKDKGFALASKKIKQERRKKAFDKILIGLARYSAKSASGRV